MTRYTLSLEQRHESELRRLVFDDERNENIAYLLCRHARVNHDPWTGAPELRLISREVVPVADADILERTAHHVSFRPETLHRLLPRCQQEDLVAVLVHSHPESIPAPSPQDDENERLLFDYAWVRDGDDTPVGSIVLTNSTIRGRIWYGWSKDPFALDAIRTTGERFAFHRTDVPHRSSPVFQRQVLAFGKALDDELSALRVVVVGAGGTGSATAMLLARLGVGRLAIIDPDLVETTNLNRLHGATQADADAGRTKVAVVARMVADMALGVQVRGFANYVDDPICQDVLKSADVIFGCTDDNDGRLFLNRLAYYYNVPTIDVGLMIEPSKDELTPSLKHLIGRITTLYPGATCLACRGVADSNEARDELLKRNEPGRYARLKAEGYVRGSGNPRPAVVTFTTATAAMAVNELIHRLNGFHAISGDHRLHDFLEESDMVLAPKSCPGCKFCDTMQYAGMGDTESFLDRSK
jgi:molybdopterin/thiamine biosynthesis adenylyltransferase/proteasome lid subunit RPN8/RPN11